MECFFGRSGDCALDSEEGDASQASCGGKSSSATVEREETDWGRLAMRDLLSLGLSCGRYKDLVAFSFLSGYAKKKQEGKGEQLEKKGWAQKKRIKKNVQDQAPVQIQIRI